MAVVSTRTGGVQGYRRLNAESRSRNLSQHAASSHTPASAETALFLPAQIRPPSRDDGVVERHFQEAQ